MNETRLNLASVPLLPLTVAFIAGILLGQISAGIMLAVIIGIAAGILSFTGFKYLGIITSATATGIIVSIIGAPVTPPDSYIGREVILSGTVTEMKEGEATRNLVIKVDSVNCRRVRPFKVYTVCWNFNPEIFAADHIRFKTTLSRADNETDIPLEFNFGEYLYRKGITVTSVIQKGSDVLTLYPAKGLRNSIIRCRLNVVDYIASSRLLPESKTFLITVLTGDSSFLLSSERETFSRAGVAHVLALSGLHVAIITMVIYLLLFPLTLVRANRLKGIIAVIVLWLFAVMTGLTPSVTRSVIMASVFLMAMLLERRPAPVNSLCFAALCILVADPLAVYSIGFQLSFTAVIFILLLAGKLNPVNKRVRPGYQIAGWFTTSFAAAMGTGVIAAMYFHVFPVYFLAVNIPFTVFLPFILGGGIIFLLLLIAGIQPQWLVDTLDFMCSLLGRITTWVSSLPGSSIDNIYISPFRLAFFLFAIAAIAVMLYFPGRKTVATAIVCSLSVIVFSVFSPATVDDDSIYFPRFKRYTVVLIPQKPVLKVYTTASTPDIAELHDNIGRRYETFMVSRGLDSINITPVHNRILSIGGRDIIFSDRMLPVDASDRKQMLILTRGFSPIYLNDSVSMPDTVYLSPCLNQKIADRLKDSLQSHGHKAVSLKNTNLVIKEGAKLPAR
ncbi:MAG: competence protein ComEC family protein [Duncaniella sp.]|nr:competence protein ComEC family protein [Duncaniella sp.]